MHKFFARGWVSESKNFIKNIFHQLCFSKSGKFLKFQWRLLRSKVRTTTQIITSKLMFLPVISKIWVFGEYEFKLSLQKL